MLRRAPAFRAWSGVVYRATSYDVPLWVRSNRRAGRWNWPGVRATQYLSLDSETPFAELLRHEDLRSEEDAATYRSTIWQLRVDEGAVVDYSTFDLAEAAGFSADALVDDDQDRCRAEADWLVAQGARALVSPSAALPGATNLTLFGPRVAVRWGTATRLASSVPAQKLPAGPPPGGLTARTRYFGAPHPDLERHRARVAARRSR